MFRKKEPIGFRFREKYKKNGKKFISAYLPQKN